MSKILSSLHLKICTWHDDVILLEVGIETKGQELQSIYILQIICAISSLEFVLLDLSLTTHVASWTGINFNIRDPASIGIKPRGYKFCPISKIG
jgi:hypothetical protein